MEEPPASGTQSLSAVIVVASLTGNTLFVAQKIAQGLRESRFERTEVVDVTLPLSKEALSALCDAISSAEAVGFGSPSTGLHQISSMTSALAAIVPSGTLRGKSAFVFCTCGADTQLPGRTNLNIAEALERGGATVVESLVVFAPHNMRTLPGKHWEWSESEVGRASQFGRDVAPLLCARPAVRAVVGASLLSRCISWAVGRTMSNVVFGGISADAGLCSRCGHCTRVCPQKAIAIEDAVPVVDHALCDRCFRCVNLCPRHALSSRSLNPALQYSFSPSCVVPGDFTARLVDNC